MLCRCRVGRRGTGPFATARIRNAGSRDTKSRGDVVPAICTSAAPAALLLGGKAESGLVESLLAAISLSIPDLYDQTFVEIRIIRPVTVRIADYPGVAHEVVRRVVNVSVNPKCRLIGLD